MIARIPTLASDGMTKLESEYLKVFLKLSSRNLDFGSSKIELSLLFNDSFLTHQIVSSLTDILIGKIYSDEKALLKIFNYIELLYNSIMQLERKYPNKGILNEIRFLLTSILEKGNNLLDKPKTNFIYQNCSSLFTRYFTTQEKCVCSTCFKIENTILGKPIKSKTIIIQNSMIEHVLEQFQGELLSERTPCLIPFSELLKISTASFGKLRHKVEIIKQPLISFDLQHVHLFVQATNNLYSNIPTKAKSARKRYIPPSKQNPPKKKQKI